MMLDDLTPDDAETGPETGPDGAEIHQLDFLADGADEQVPSPATPTGEEGGGDLRPGAQAAVPGDPGLGLAPRRGIEEVLPQAFGPGDLEA